MSCHMCNVKLVLKGKVTENQSISSLHRLQQEVSVLVKDLETSQVTIKEFQSRLTVSERRGDDLAAKLREMTNLFEKADKGRFTYDVHAEEKRGRGVY